MINVFLIAGMFFLVTLSMAIDEKNIPLIVSQWAGFALCVIGCIMMTERR